MSHFIHVTDVMVVITHVYVMALKYYRLDGHYHISFMSHIKNVADVMAVTTQVLDHNFNMSYTCWL